MNAKKEVLEAIKDAGKSMKDIDYGYIYLDGGGNRMEFEGHIRSHQLALLNVEYDAGYGGQELDGIIVFHDGSWLDRGEYDGSEWWDYNSTPGRDRVLQADIDRSNLKLYKETIIEYTDHPELSHLAGVYKDLLQDLLDKGVKDD